MSDTPARDALDGLVEVLAHEEGLNPAESAAALAWVAENFDIVLASIAESWRPTADQLRAMGGEGHDMHVHGPWCVPFCDEVDMAWHFPKEATDE